MEHHDNEAFREYLQVLMDLIKKAIASNKRFSPDLKGLSDKDKKDVNFTVCFVNLFPPMPEDMDEFDLGINSWSNGGDQEMSGSAKESHQDLCFELTLDDMDFLRKNGISFS